MAEATAPSTRFSGLLVDGLRMPVTLLTCAASIAVTLWCWSRDSHAGIEIDPRGLFASPWTPITSALSHVNTLHLLFNLYWMWRFGAWIERRVGSPRTLLLYLVLAFMSSAAEYAWDHGGIGLSGVGYGLFGLLWVRRRVEPAISTVLDPAAIRIFVVWFFLCIALTETNLLPVANAADLFGALEGAGIAWVWNREPGHRRVPAILLAASFALLIDLATLGRPLVNRGPGISLSYAMRAVDAHDRHQFDESLELATRAVALDPSNGFARWYLGCAQVMTGAELEGLRSLRRANEQGTRTEAPEQTWLQWMKFRVNTVSASEDWTTVGRLANEMLRIDETCVEAWAWLGHSESRGGTPSQACTAFERAYELDSTHTDMRQNWIWAKLTRARLAYEAGDLERAEREVHTGLSMAPEDPNLLEAKRWYEGKRSR